MAPNNPDDGGGAPDPTKDDGTTNNEHNDPSLAIEKDKQVKKRLVLETIKSHCSETSEHVDLRNIATGLKDGSGKLEIKVIAGGCTNFSYKVSFESNDNKDDNSISLFAKLSFPYALWNPDPDVHYDVQRTENEFLIMKKLADIMPNAPVATPYLCVSIDDMKLFVTQWSSADEQWANQWIDGTVDTRVIPKLAQTLALLHCQDFDPEFNTNVRPCMLTLFPAMKEKLQDFIANPDSYTGQRTPSLAQEYGQDVCNQIIDANLSNYNNDRDCLVHSDAHAFNILVEKKPDNVLEHFGPNGDIILCDWEMVFAGPIGRDIGLTFSFPISSMIAHAFNGNDVDGIISNGFWNALDLMWNEYANALVKEGNKDDEFLCKTYRNCLAWCGWFIFLAHYVLGCQREFLPFEDNTTEEDKETVYDSIGVAGLKLLRLGYYDDDVNDEKGMTAIQELQASFKHIVQQELDLLSAIAASRKKQRRRRTSLLRASGRRLSDAGMHFISRPSIRGSLLSSTSSIAGSIREVLEIDD